ncbi:hypothetical protein ON010_g529 [Phytophthora cinnamomi]|nr:hypothetical protein ON010_g529 [Phytophthora cinnamomi]
MRERCPADSSSLSRQVAKAALHRLEISTVVAGPRHERTRRRQPCNLRRPRQPRKIPPRNPRTTDKNSWCAHDPMQVLELAIEEHNEDSALAVLQSKQFLRYLSHSRVRLATSLDEWQRVPDRAYNVQTCAIAAVRSGMDVWGPPSLAQPRTRENSTSDVKQNKPNLLYCVPSASQLFELAPANGLPGVDGFWLPNVKTRLRLDW